MRTTDQFDALRTVDDRALDRERERLRDIDAPPRRDRLDHRIWRYGFRAVDAEPGEELGNVIVEDTTAQPWAPFPLADAVERTGVAGQRHPDGREQPRGQPNRLTFDALPRPPHSPPPRPAHRTAC